MQARNYTAQMFWEWFKERNTAFLSINSTTITNEDKNILLDEIEEKLHEYCDALYFEIGGWPDQEHELIITADGDSEFFPVVDELIQVAPKIDRWSFTALLQARELDYTSNFEDVELKPLEIWFLPLNLKSDPNRIGLRICLPNYNSVKGSDWLHAAVLRMLDTAVGEREYASR